MALTKLFQRIFWANNTTPAINETNLNAMSKAIDDIDDRVIDLAANIMETVPELQEMVEEMEVLTENPPYIGANGNWYVWDTSTNQYVDSGVDASITVSVGTTTTLPAGSSATVTNTGTSTDPVLNFGIPQGEKGDTGNTGATPNITASATIDSNVGTPAVSITQGGTAENPTIAFGFSNLKGETGSTGATGQDGVSPSVSISSITDGHTVTITDADHPSGQSFNVLDGADGAAGQDGADGVSPEVTIASITGGTQVTITDADHPSGQSFNVMNGTGSGDMTAAIYDDDSAVANAGGIADFVDGKIEDIVDYVTPQMYGAKADGTTDDTQAVLAALNSGNPRVYFPAGTYLIQWLNTISMTNGRNLVVYGAGKFESILHFTDGRESNSDGYGIKFQTGSAGTSSIIMRNLGIYHDNQDTSVTYTTVCYNMLTFDGQFKTIDVDNIYIHSGYNATNGAAKPYNTCIWGRAGAEDLRITNSVFENYTNRIKGGGLWWSPSNWSTKFTCGHVEFSGNTFRHTNNDEAIAFWALGDENDPEVFRDDEFNMREVKMVNNTIIHANFNGECYQTDYLINFAARKWNKNLAANYVFSGNKIILEKSKLGVFRTENLDEVVISDNDIYVGSIIAQDNANTWHVVAPIGGRVVFKHNMFNCQAPANTDRVNIVTYKSTFEVIQNVFRSSFWLVLVSWNPGVDYENPDKDNQGTCINFVGNVLENKSIGVEATNNTRFNIIDNSINGTINFQGTQTSGSYITLKGNRFRYRYGDITEANLKGRDVKVVENTGLKLIVNSANISTAMAYFEYVGRKEDLVFKVSNNVVPDSAAVRAQFFTSCDIVYYDEEPRIKTQTLAASGTTVTFTGLPTSGNYMIDFFIEGGANYTAINTATAGQVTLTYAAESSARTVYCKIEEVR